MNRESQTQQGLILIWTPPFLVLACIKIRRKFHFQSPTFPSKTFIKYCRKRSGNAKLKDYIYISLAQQSSHNPQNNSNVLCFFQLMSCPARNTVWNSHNETQKRPLVNLTKQSHCPQLELKKAFCRGLNFIEGKKKPNHHCHYVLHSFKKNRDHIAKHTSSL